MLLPAGAIRRRRRRTIRRTCLVAIWHRSACESTSDRELWTTADAADLQEDSADELLQACGVAVVAEGCEGGVGPGSVAWLHIREVNHGEEHPTGLVWTRDQAGGDPTKACSKEVQQMAVAGGPGDEVGDAATEPAAVVAGQCGAACVSADAACRGAAEQGKNAYRRARRGAKRDVIATHGDDENVIGAYVVAGEDVVL